jgi:hypothetical protein
MRLKNPFSRWLRCLALAASILLVLPHALTAQSVTTEPVGFNKVTCLANSDTIVGVPLRVQGSITTKLTAAPVVNGAISANLTLHNNALPVLTKHYLKFNGGAADGRWYDITANTANTVTIDLNGDTLPAVASDNSVTIAEYWTLDSLFPPAGATTSWTLNTETSTYVPNGHAIVSSIGTSPSGRRTQILFPSYSTFGTNRPSTEIFYINRNTNAWVRVGGSVTPPGETVIYPDTSLTMRHPSSVTYPTVFRALGEVVTTNHTIVLATRPLGSGNNDNYVAIPRPIDVSLWDLNIVQSGAFTPSGGTSPSARRDQLLVYNNALAMINKPADAIYYYLVDKWVKAGDATLESRNGTLIPAGAGLIIRKYNTSGGASSYWVNTPKY